MGHFILTNWSFLPYFALLSCLAVMSVREGLVNRDSGGGGAN
jgi:hypothetical protein